MVGDRTDALDGRCRHAAGLAVRTGGSRPGPGRGQHHGRKCSSHLHTAHCSVRMAAYRWLTGGLPATAA